MSDKAECSVFSEFNSTPDNNLAIQEKIAKYRSSLPKEQLEFIEDGEFCFYGNTLSEKIKARGFSSLLNLFLHKLLSLISEKSKTKGWWEGDYSSIKLVDSENAFQHAIKQLQSNNIAKKIKDTLLFEVWSVLSSSLERDTSTADNWSVNSAIDSALKINKKLNKLGWPLRGRNILLAEQFYKKTNTVVDFDLCSSWLAGLILPDQEQMKIIESITEQPSDNDI